eukprot:1274346-Pyramimonas_sp.AAC.1
MGWDMPEAAEGEEEEPERNFEMWRLELPEKAPKESASSSLAWDRDSGTETVGQRHTHPSTRAQIGADKGRIGAAD